MITSIILVILIFIAMSTTMYMRYCSLVPDNVRAFSQSFEKRIYLASHEEVYLVNGFKIPWYLIPLIKNDLEGMLAQGCLLREDFCEEDGTVIQKSLAFLKALEEYAFLNEQKKLLTGKEGRGDSFFNITAPFKYRRFTVFARLDIF